MSENAGGDSAASPTPTPTRASSSCAKFRAAPHAAVMKLQIPMPHAMIARRLRWSAIRAIGNPRMV